MLHLVQTVRDVGCGNNQRIIQGGHRGVGALPAVDSGIFKWGASPRVRGQLTMFESGAILEYVIECYGNGRLAPAPGSALRGPYLQGLHFAEATAFPPIGEMVRHTIFKPESERIPAVVADARGRAQVTLGVLEKALGDKDYLIGDFSGADVMMGFTLVAAKLVGALDDRFPNLQAYLARLEGRPAFQKAAAT